MKKVILVLTVICMAALLLCACEVPQTNCEHTYGDWTVTKAATCAEKGEEQRVCSKCQNVDKRETELVDHAYGDWAVTRPATAQEDGEEQRECAVCHKIETRSVSKLTDGAVTDFAFDGGLYTGNVIAGIPNDTNGKFVKDGMTFEGVFENGVATQGKMTYAREYGLVEYTGKFVAFNQIDTSVTGEGCYTFDDGCNYRGGIRANDENGDSVIYQGQGTFKWFGTENVDTLVATFENGAPTTGTKTFACGDKYEGQFNAEFNFDVKGKYTFANGMYYEGDYVNGKRHGEGMFSWSTNGDYTTAWYYKGQFENDNTTVGTKYFVGRPTGVLQYTGRFVNLDAIDTSVDGTGIFDYGNGCWYQGGIHANDVHAEGCVFQGEGTFKWGKGDNVDTLVATFVNSAPTTGTKTFVNGDKYEGGFTGFDFGGKGKYTFANGMYYEGDYVNGKRHGEGMFSWSTNGDYTTAWYYKGKFENDNATVGTKYFADRTEGVLQYTGRFVNLDAIDTSVEGVAYVKDATHDGWYNVTVSDAHASSYTIVSEYVEE